MGDTWITSLAHILDESGAIAAPKAPGRKLAEHIVAIVAMASRPEIEIHPKKVIGRNSRNMGNPPFKMRRSPMDKFPPFP